jgi:hypothetical protein
MTEQPSKGRAFLKGGCGGLVLFAVFALLAVVFRGHAHADIGGLVLFFMIGGVVGLVVLAIYNRGRRAGHVKARGTAGASLQEIMSGALRMLFGVAFVSFGCWIFLAYSAPRLLLVHRANAWPEIPCVVLHSEVEIEKDDDGVTCRPAIRYSYVIDDVERQSDVIDFLLAPDGSRSQAEECLAAYPVGATRTCYVDPRDPERVTLRRGWRQEHIAAFVPLLILGLGACQTFYGTRWWLQRLKRNG